MIYKKLIKIIIDILSPIEIIINIAIQYYDFINLIIIDKNLFFISKF